MQGTQASVEGPRKYLTVQEKKKIHDEIDRRMQELEDTGLSRVELLHDSMARKGVQLKDDPFF